MTRNIHFRHPDMFRSSTALSTAIFLAALTASVPARAACTTDQAGGQIYNQTCTGTDGTAGGDGAGENDAVQGGRGGAPAGIDVSLTDNLSGAPGATTVLVSGSGGRGGAGGNGIGQSSYSNGASGGDGGATALINVYIDSQISEGGSGARAVVIRAAGGDGGNGGTGGSHGAGGAGGAGAGAGQVNFTTDTSGTVSSTERGAAAVLIEASGGNGGAAGYAETWIADAKGKAGGAGGSGSDIVVALNNNIVSAGTGLLAISQGGNGGNGGSAGTDFGGAAEGGNGGAGGRGGAITVAIEGDISAMGADKAGTGQILTMTNGQTIQFSETAAAVQLLANGGIGGAGGNGNGNAGKGQAGNGGSVDASGAIDFISYHSNLSTSLYGAAGLLVQSIAGYGGNGAYAGGMFVATGGEGAPGGTAGAITVHTTSGSTRTAGAASDALVLQSIGGGGGYGGAASVSGVSIGVALGGDSGNGGDGGSVTFLNGTPGYDANNLITSMSDGQLIATAGYKSDGLIAQSIGGGGGKAGDANAQVLDGFISIAIGGHAGKGGDGGSLGIDLGGIIQTKGESSDGVLAQSIGGGGGDGGAAHSLVVGAMLTSSTAIGGSAGVGGTGGAVHVGNYQQIGTDGANAFGIVAQSIGGGGGRGGSSLAQNIQLFNDPTVPSVNMTVAVGGQGGSGGDGGNTDVLNRGNVLTGGAGSFGILAQSVGGGGGAGGDASSWDVAFRSSTINVNTVIGGSGGAGGNAGTVTVDNLGLVATLNENATAIIAQSIGGGGGAGGSGNALTESVKSTDISGQIAITVGGTGGAAGFGNTVSVINRSGGGILTLGNGAYGVFAQSIGGGGGAGAGALTDGSGGGKLNMNVAVGGTGGAAGNGGGVILVNQSAISTSGGSSSAVYAQSIGGGGGVGGNATLSTGGWPATTISDFITQGLGVGAGVTNIGGIDALNSAGEKVWDTKEELDKIRDAYKTLNPDKGEKPESFTSQMSVDVGGGIAGQGGAAGNGGQITIENSGDISTSGAFSEGILAQSIGGGGGNGGAAHSSNGTSVFNGSFGLGGNAGSTGHGGEIDIVNTGSIQTVGDTSFGVFGQSVGGGGGKGGISTGDPEVATDVTVNIGGDSGSNGDGGAVNITSSGDVATSGAYAIGLIGQSVGAGGGVSGVFNIVTEGGSASSRAGISDHFSLRPVTVGGAGGAGGVGGSVTIELGAGAITTTGVDAYGVLAQSIGGSGGLVAGKLVQSEGATSNDVFPDGGLIGDGGTVTVLLDSNANITTSGAGAVGVLAQSLGGGGILQGGVSQIDFSAPVQTATGRVLDGQGNDISVHVDYFAHITTTGEKAFGILAQSVGGGGGLYGHADGTGFQISGPRKDPCPEHVTCFGQVTVNVEGYVETSGAGADAIRAISRSNGKEGVNVNIGGGSGVVGASGAGASGLFIDAPWAQNSLTNNGYLSGSAAAITTNGALTITNDLWINGNILATDGAQVTLNNRGRLYTGPVMEVASLTNSGEIWLGDKATNFTFFGGNVNSSGRIITGVDFAAGKADGAAVLTGQLTLSGLVLVNPVTLTSGKATIFTSAQPIVLGALKAMNYTYNQATDVITPVAPYLYSYTLTLVNKDILQISATANFTASDVEMTHNRQNLATHFQKTWDAGISDSAPMTALLRNVTDVASYRRALDSLGAHGLASAAVLRAEVDRSFAGEMESCSSGAVEASGEPERNCAWARVGGGVIHNSLSYGLSGFDATSVLMQMGGQTEVGEGWFLGGSLAYVNEKIDADDHLSTMDGDGIVAGLFAKRQSGPFLAALGVTAGSSWYDSTRAIRIGEDSSFASGKPGVSHVGGHARLAWQTPGERWRVRTIVDLDLTHVSSRGFSEHGSDLALEVKSSHGTIFTAAPTVEIGRSFVDGDHIIRPFLRAGAVLRSDNGWFTAARFAIDPKQIDPFTSETQLPQQTGRIGGGLDIALGNRFNLQVQYEGELGDHYVSHRGSFHLVHRF